MCQLLAILAERQHAERRVPVRLGDAAARRAQQPHLGALIGDGVGERGLMVSDVSSGCCQWRQG